MRKRKHQVKIWMSDEEYALLKQKIKEAEEYRKYPDWARQFYELRIGESL